MDRRTALGMLGTAGLGGLVLAGCGESGGAAQAASREPGAHTATRLTLDTALSYEQFVSRFEATVPELPTAQMQAKLKAGKTDEVRKLLESSSPVGMYLFYTLDATPFMAAAGHTAKAKSYLVGNPLLAEQMFAVDPGMMLYAPVRLLIHTDATDAAHVSFDRPSDLFASFGSAEIAATGKKVDAALGRILTKVGVTVPAALIA